METIDEEVTALTLDYLEKAKKADKPFFLWWNSTRMHIFTHLKEASKGKTGLGTYPDGMVEHDGHVGQILDKLKELGLDENTIVMYSTDNGAEVFSWPDGGTTPFRGEKNENWEGGYRVPCVIRWPGVIKPGTINNDIYSHEDMLPTHPGGGRRARCEGAVAQGHEGRQDDLQGAPRRLQHHRFAGGQGARTRARSSSTGTTTVRWWRCATTSGRSSSRSSANTALRSGRSRSWRCACPSSSTCAPTRSRSPTMWPWITTIGGLIASSCWCRRRNTSRKYIATFKEFPPSQKVGSFSLDHVLASLLVGGTSGK